MGQREADAARVQLPQLRPQDLDPAQLALYQRIVDGPRRRMPEGSVLVQSDGVLRGPFNAMLVNPVLGEALQSTGVALRFHTSLSDRVRELAILATASATNCEYEWNAHAPIARELGVTEQQLEAVRLGQPLPDVRAAEASAVSLVRVLIEPGVVDDDELGDAVDQLGLSGAVEIVFLVGYYQMLARSLIVWRVEPMTINPA